MCVKGDVSVYAVLSRRGSRDSGRCYLRQESRSCIELPLDVLASHCLHGCAITTTSCFLRVSPVSQTFFFCFPGFFLVVSNLIRCWPHLNWYGSSPVTGDFLSIERTDLFSGVWLAALKSFTARAVVKAPERKPILCETYLKGRVHGPVEPLIGSSLV